MKILVANRAEIACRVFQTAKEMGLQTVAIFTEADIDARHVTMADEAVQVSSYLEIPEILRACKLTNANLVHPGYGFLSERAPFVDALEKEGITFIGPRAETMRALGEKISAKEIAEKSKVPTLPWAKIKDLKELPEIAKNIGFPLLLKAAAGGGGKGMRRVDREKDLIPYAEAAMRESEAAFGDGTLFVEKLLVHPRHIEVQIFGDGNGHVTHLFERDCSLQRRHQKVWEEAPSLRLSEKTKKDLFASAIRLGEALQYRSAGTLEYLVDEKENFYFLEVNTRLQVEHPVTELITGVDLVRAQILQAQNPKTTVLKETPMLRGHAIEVRIYAEDPLQNYIPTPGSIEKLKWPTGVGIRIDSGVEEGQKIGTGFDPMIAKLIVWNHDRDSALQRMKYALSETYLLGMGSNLLFLRALCDQEFMKSGKIHTSTLSEWNSMASDLGLSEEEKKILQKMIKEAGASANTTSSESSSPSIPSPFVHFSGGGV